MSRNVGNFGLSIPSPNDLYCTEDTLEELKKRLGDWSVKIRFQEEKVRGQGGIDPLERARLLKDLTLARNALQNAAESLGAAHDDCCQASRYVHVFRDQMTVTVVK